MSVISEVFNTDVAKAVGTAVAAAYGWYVTHKLKIAEKQREIAVQVQAAAILEAKHAVSEAVTAAQASVTASQATQAAVGEPNGQGPANRMLEVIVYKLDGVVAAQKVAGIAHEGLSTRVAILASKVDSIAAGTSTVAP